MANDDATPDPAKLLKLARQALTSAEFRKKFHLADFWGPGQFYEPQLKFFTDGARYHQRLIRGGNQVGKRFACAFEANLHLTGQYPNGGPARGSASRPGGGLSGSLRSSCVTVRNGS